MHPTMKDTAYFVLTCRTDEMKTACLCSGWMTREKASSVAKRMVLERENTQSNSDFFARFMKKDKGTVSSFTGTIDIDPRSMNVQRNKIAKTVPRVDRPPIPPNFLYRFNGYYINNRKIYFEINQKCRMHPTLANTVNIRIVCSSGKKDRKTLFSGWLSRKEAQAVAHLLILEYRAAESHFAFFNQFETSVTCTASSFIRTVEGDPRLKKTNRATLSKVVSRARRASVPKNFSRGLGKFFIYGRKICFKIDRDAGMHPRVADAAYFKITCLMDDIIKNLYCGWLTRDEASTVAHILTLEHMTSIPPIPDPTLAVSESVPRLLLKADTPGYRIEMAGTRNERCDYK